MKLIFTLLTLIACTATVPAEEWKPSLVSVRGDFQEASVVVRMNITDTRITDTKTDPQYYFFTARGEVMESFKGKFKPGQIVEFSVRAEYGYEHASMRGHRIAFLTSFVNRRNGPFQELPSSNSVIPYSADLLDKVRTVRREWYRRRKNHH